jgi:hypothetical protein
MKSEFLGQLGHALRNLLAQPHNGLPAIRLARDSKAWSRETGCNGYLVKPLSLPELEELLAQ